MTSLYDEVTVISMSIEAKLCADPALRATSEYAAFQEQALDCFFAILYRRLSEGTVLLLRDAAAQIGRKASEAHNA